MNTSEMIAAGYKMSHTSYSRGYVRVGHTLVKEYKGRFGEGFAVYTNNRKSSQYCFVTYYVK